MTDKTVLWDKLGRTDPAHTKSFKRAGGFSGTAIKPMFSYKRMTEEFGPCGEGWGINEPSFQVVPGDNREVLVYCTVSIWHGDRTKVVFGVGGDKVISHIKANDQYKRPERWENDDEAFKKAFTDAVTNALKLIGVGADVHMGMFDDNKYVNAVRAEFEEEAKPAPEPVVKSSAQLKRERSWETVVDELELDMVDVRNLVQFEKLKQDYREKVSKEGWPAAWKYQLKDKLEGYENEIRAMQNNAAEEDTVSDIQEQFKGARIVNETHPLMAG